MQKYLEMVIFVNRHLTRQADNAPAATAGTAKF